MQTMDWTPVSLLGSIGEGQDLQQGTDDAPQCSQAMSEPAFG